MKNEGEEVRNLRKKKIRFPLAVKAACVLVMLAVLSSPIASQATAGGFYLTASWYSVESLKKEGTWKTSQGRMANGQKFNENDFTCATRLFPLGSRLVITNVATGRRCVVRVTDRIGKRFAHTRIDLSKKAFSRIADCKQGIIEVFVEEI